MLSGKVTGIPVKPTRDLPQVDDVTGAEGLEAGGGADDQAAVVVEGFGDTFDGDVAGELDADGAPDGVAALQVGGGEEGVVLEDLPALVDELEGGEDGRDQQVAGRRPRARRAGSRSSCPRCGS